MDAEDAVMQVTEALPELDGFGAWHVASPESHGFAVGVGCASAYVEVTVPEGHGTDGVAHLIAKPEGGAYTAKAPR